MVRSGRARRWTYRTHGSVPPRADSSFATIRRSHSGHGRLGRARRGARRTRSPRAAFGGGRDARSGQREAGRDLRISFEVLNVAGRLFGGGGGRGARSGQRGAVPRMVARPSVLQEACSAQSHVGQHHLTSGSSASEYALRVVVASRPWRPEAHVVPGFHNNRPVTIGLIGRFRNEPERHSELLDAEWSNLDPPEGDFAK